MNRKIKRASMRFAYDVLSKKWKEQLFKQNFYARLMGNDKIPDSIKNEMVGRKPSFSVFMKVMNGVSNPVKVISESTPVEFITFVDENLESMGNKILWRGIVPNIQREQTTDGENTPFVPTATE